MNPYYIILADDHSLVRKGLRKIIEEWPDLKVVGEVGDGAALLQLLSGVIAHLVILDISMPNATGLDVIREIRIRYPKIKILILTMHRCTEYLFLALDSGADGYLLKEDADTELFAAIQRIRQNAVYASPALENDLLEYRRRAGLRTSGTSSQRESLSYREREVLMLIAEGKSSREVASMLSISASTVDHHRANIMSKLNLRKSAELVKYAIDKGFTVLHGN